MASSPLLAAGLGHLALHGILVARPMRGRSRSRLGLLLTCLYAWILVAPSNFVLCTEPDGSTDLEPAASMGQCLCACLFDAQTAAPHDLYQLAISERQTSTAISAQCTDVWLTGADRLQQTTTGQRILPVSQAAQALHASLDAGLLRPQQRIFNPLAARGCGPPGRSQRIILRI